MTLSSVPGGSEHGADQWLRGPRHKAKALLRPPPQAPQVLGDPLAPPGHVHLRTDPALRAAAPGGRVEVGEPSATPTNSCEGGGKKKNRHVPCSIRYDLRVRYIPSNFMDIFQDDRTTMLYFYLQVSRARPSCICQQLSFKFSLCVTAAEPSVALNPKLGIVSVRPCGLSVYSFFPGIFLRRPDDRNP